MGIADYFYKPVPGWTPIVGEHVFLRQPQRRAVVTHVAGIFARVTYQERGKTRMRLATFSELRPQPKPWGRWDYSRKEGP